MPRAKTTSDLVSEIRVAAFLPDTGSLTDAEILALAQGDLSTIVAEVLGTAGPSHGLALYDTTLVSGTAAYLMPDRARGATIASVAYVTTSSVELPIEPVPVTDAWMGSVDTSWGVQPRYYLRGDHMVLVPTPGAGEAGRTLRVRYSREQPKLVPTSEAIAITKVDPPAPPEDPRWKITGSTTVPSSFNAAGYVDIVRGDRTHQPIYTDLLTYSASGSTLDLDPSVTIDDDLIADTTVITYGTRQDYVCVAGCSVFPHVPSEPLWRVLVDSTAARILRSIGDAQGASVLERPLADSIARARRQLQPRSRQAEVLAGGGSLRLGAMRRRAWWGS